MKTTTTTVTTTTTELIKPIFVYVFWSESNNFIEKGLYNFKEFELKARIAAIENGDYGYCKTKIQVLFSNGDDYACRLDLATNDDTGFKQHAANVINYQEQNHKDEKCEYVNFLKAINWD